MFGVQQLNGQMFHCTGHNGSPQIQDDGLRTGTKNCGLALEIAFLSRLQAEI